MSTRYPVKIKILIQWDWDGPKTACLIGCQVVPMLLICFDKRGLEAHEKTSTYSNGPSGRECVKLQTAFQSLLLRHLEDEEKYPRAEGL